MKEKKSKIREDSLEENIKLCKGDYLGTIREEDDTSIYEYDLPCLKYKERINKK